MAPKFTTVYRFNQRALLAAWMLLGSLVIIGTQLSSTIWAFANPMPHHWDNAEYLNQTYKDYWAWKYGGPVNHKPGLSGEWDSLMNQDPVRPPGYRMVSVPFLFFGIRMLPLLRAISLTVFWLTLFVLYRTCTTVIDGPAGKAAGMLAAMLVSLYSEIGWSIRVYGTEHTLYLSVALTLFFLARSTREHGKSHLTWISLGLAMGFGLLSKLSFIMLAGPSGAMAFALVLTRKLPGLSIWKLAAACAIALLMAWPYYHMHLLSAYQYGSDMTKFQRHSLNKSGTDLLRTWIQLHIDQGTGSSAAAMIGRVTVAAAIAAMIRWIWRFWSTRSWKPAIGPVGLTVLLALSQGLPILLFQLIFSTSDNVRQMTPAYFPLTIAVALMAASAGVLMAWWCWAMLIAAAIPAFAQVDRDYFPMTSTPDDAWDWDPLYQIIQQRHLRFPMIGHVGNTMQFCDPTITYPWICRGGWASSLWLWRYEDGTYNPQKVHDKLIDRDIVLTAINLHMLQSTGLLAEPFDQDNAHNSEFADAMLHDPEWELAGQFPIGIINQAEIQVFVRKTPLKR